MIAMPHLSWFPKPFGPGDTDGTGQQRALGQPSYEPRDILIREMAQNSWDARLVGGVIPEFEMRLRTLGATETDVLTWNVLTDTTGLPSLTAALKRDHLTAIEIVDRGTKGLGGPTRNDLAFRDGVPKDYADFVLTLGAPPDAPGGGTYGYGKTAAYSASACCTIIIWSRWRNPATDTLEDRLIASAMGPSFVMGGLQYTGRQWWGLVQYDGSKASRVEPATGDEAAILGRALFERHFTEDETGTSLLVLDPKHDRLSSEDGDSPAADLWRQAVLHHLWPKIAEDQAPSRRMTIRLFDHGTHVPLLDQGSVSDVLDAGQQCLEAVREVQEGRTNQNPLVVMREIRSLSPRQLLGHLALCRVGLVSATDPLRTTADTVTYMRNTAELVVTTASFGSESHANSHWVGVFKPVKNLDEHFAQSEPPAHDAWHYASMQDERAKGTVRRALNKVKEAMNDYLKPTPVDVAGDGSMSTGALSAALASLAGGAGGTVPTGTKVTRGGRGSGSKPASPKVHVAGEPKRYFSEGEPDRQFLVLPLRIEAEGPVLVSTTRLAIAVEGPSLDGGDEVRLEGWSHDGRLQGQDTEIRVEGGHIDVMFSHPNGTAIDIDLKAVLAP